MCHSKGAFESYSGILFSADNERKQEYVTGRVNEYSIKCYDKGPGFQITGLIYLGHIRLG